MTSTTPAPPTTTTTVPATTPAPTTTPAPSPTTTTTVPATTPAPTTTTTLPITGTRVNEVGVSLRNYLPTTAQSVSQPVVSIQVDTESVGAVFVGDEQQIRWGIPVDDEQRGLGLTSHFPPAADIPVGVEFSLATLRFFNYDVTGEQVTSATFTLNFVFANGEEVEADLTFAVGATSVTLQAGMPYTIRSGNTEIQIVEFRDTIDGTGKTALTANLGETTSTLIIAKLISSPTEESNCVPGEFDPVFNPTRCSVPDVCPISDDLIVEDCGIPVAPEPLTDCPDIDIPVGVGTPPLPGDPADGPPGEPGPPGCTPQVTASSVVLYVQSCSQQRVSITVLEYPPCNAHILVVYYLCRPYHSANDCCVYKCCGGTWEVLDGGSQCFINGQTTSTSTTNPSDPEILYPPPDGPCDSEGITAVVCPCNPPTTPSDCQGSSCECGPWEKEGGTSNMLWPSSWCPSPCTYGDVVHSTVAGGDCWTAAGSGSGCGSSLLQVCCVGGQIEMTLTCKDGSQVVYPDVIDEEDHCVFMGFFDPDNFGECCDGQSTTAVIIGTITLQKCSTTTTNTNTTTSSTTTSSTSTSTSSSTTTDPPPGSTTTSSSTTTTECPEEEQEFACRWRWNGSAWDFVENTSSCPGCECVTVPDYTPIHINEESFTDCEFS